LGTKELLQDYKMYEMVIYTQGPSQQLMTTAKKQSVARTPNKLKLQNSTFEAQSNYLLRFVSQNKYFLKITINKKWP
jgi:hypothetical protein